MGAICNSNDKSSTAINKFIKQFTKFCVTGDGKSTVDGKSGVNARSLIPGNENKLYEHISNIQNVIL